MEDIKDYLEKANAKHWARLRKNPPAFLEKVGKEITTEKMDEILAEDMKQLNNSLDSLLAKLDKCLEIQERNIKTVERIEEILPKRSDFIH